MMRTCAVLLSWLLCITCLSEAQGKSTQAGAHVRLASESPLRLHITLVSGRDTEVVIDKAQLPWSTRYAMVLTVANADGQCLEKVLPVEDASIGHVSVAAHGSIAGDLNLDGFFKGFDEARKKSDLHLFWAYKAPNNLGIAPWSGGWVLIPRSKKP